ncbi:amidohydrolase family protein [Kibdelosporangium lantanae]
MFDELPLTDHHCHGVVRRDLTEADLAGLLTEAEVGTFDSRIGLALRRWCAPVLDLPAHAPVADYVSRRQELGFADVNARFLGAAGLRAMCVDTGYVPEPILSPAELGALAGARAYEIARLEFIAEELHGSVAAADFPDAFRSLLDSKAAVGVKSIAAYRVGLGLRAERPSDAEVVAAAGEWFAGPRRLASEVLHRFLVWCGADLGLPVQFHVGLGDSDVDMKTCDPLLLTGLIRALDVPVTLLHNYPFHRNAGYLAQVFPNVYVDIGLAAHNLGDRAVTLVEEVLELAPFTKVLYSSDAFGLAEFYHLGAVLFRRGLAAVLGGGVAEGSWTATDADRLAALVATGNAARVYGLG